MMTTQDIHSRMQAQFGAAVGPLSEPKLDAFATVEAGRLVEVCRWLRDTPGVELDHCDDITAVDRPQQSAIEVVYHLFSYPHRHGIVLKVMLDRAAPTLPSVDDVWKAANFMEREVYDLFGVEFSGHPDLRRILLPDDWVGHPLRKDYQEAGGYHGVPNVRENPLVELRRLDEKRRAETAAQPPTPPPLSPSPAEEPKA